MRVLGLAFGALLAVTVPIATHANGSRVMGPANAGPGPNIVLAWDGGSSGGHSGAHGGQRTAGHPRQWNGQWGPPHWGPNRFYGSGVLMVGRGARLTGSTFRVAQSLITRSRIGAALRAGEVILSWPV
jgi:hypothetical protein